MIIPIGERINGMFKNIKMAIREKNPAAVQEYAKRQADAGAKFLDINVGTAAEDQCAAMKWLVETTQEAVPTGICIDSQKLDVIKAGLEVVKDHEILINSSKADPEALDIYMPLAKQYNASLICLTITKDGVPQDIDTRVAIAAEILGKALEHDFDIDKVFIDPILLPINCDQKQAKMMTEVFSQIRVMSDPPPHITVGLSNFSQGTNEKSLLNRTILTMSMIAGLDAPVMDVLDEELMNTAICTDVVMDHMIYSDSFLKAGKAMLVGN
ncbi:MAG: dihydropteroate synthase [Candidatus Anammoxibacter sp.]